MFKKDKRFKDTENKKGRQKEVDTVPGPGAYSIDMTPLKPKQTVHGFAKTPKHEMHSKIEQLPGPGNYNGYNNNFKAVKNNSHFNAYSFGQAPKSP